MAYWDSTGQQLLTNGTGHWREINVQQHRRIEGQVLNEQPDGEWQLYHLTLDPTKPLAIETYERGVFKKGRSMAKLNSFTYHDQPQLVPVFDDSSAQGMLYKRGVTCEELANRRKGIFQFGSQKVTFSKQANADAKSITPARPDGDASTYLRMLLQKLSDTPSMNALLRDPQYAAEVDADIDELGKLSNFRSLQDDIRHVFTRIVPPLGRWYAASLNGQPARCHVRFKLSVLDEHWQIRYQLSGVQAGPAAAAQP